MKKVILSLLILLTFLFCQSQNILIVDNNAGAPTGTHVYGTLQAAIDATVPGDIIHVIPSPNNYGNVTINAAQSGISIFGIGFNPDKDGPAKSQVNQIFVYASDIRLSGLRVIDQIGIGTSSNTVNNVAIENCNIGRISSTTVTSFNGSNILIRNCYVGLSNPFDVVIDLSYRISNSVITNCIIGGYTGTSTAYGSVTAYNGSVVKNNIFFAPGGVGNNAFDNLVNCTVSNNIFFGREPRWRTSGGSLSNCVFNNNVSAGSDNNALPPITTSGNSGNNNFVSLVDSTLIFEDPSIVIGDIWDFNWIPTLKSGSILLNGGTDGTNVGPTGSTIPWDPTGVPLPLIQSVISSEIIKQGDNLDVTIKARGN